MPLKATRFPFDQVPQFSQRDIAYTLEDQRLASFYKYPVNLQSFEQVIQNKQNQDIDRDLLVEVLKDQYQHFSLSEETQHNIEALAQKQTFTVITAHQPSLFTGPLYFIYKICSAIHLAEQLQEHYPEYHFVPLFISGGEDHDFEEINHLNLFGKSLVWENQENGAVGRMQTQSLQAVIQQLEEILGQSENAQWLTAKIKGSFSKHQSYGKAMLDFVNELFRAQGLVVLSMDNPKLKAAFRPIMEKELFENPSQKLIQDAQDKLEALGFSGQAYPREINLFYLGDQFRERIVFEDGYFQVLNQDIRFTEAQIREELKLHPERFSPNVVIRPLYQEFILPNLAYVGGGGELAYWLERKDQFEHFDIPYPMLVRRNSVMVLDKGTLKRVKKLELSHSDLFTETETLIKAFVKRQADEPLNLTAEIAKQEALIEDVIKKAEKIDPTLVPKVKATGAEQVKSLQRLEGRLMKAEKQKHETAVNQIRNLKEKLFPGNGLQERHDNFMGFFLKYGPDFLVELKQHLNPLVKEMVILEET